MKNTCLSVAELGKHQRAKKKEAQESLVRKINPDGRKEIFKPARQMLYTIMDIVVEQLVRNGHGKVIMDDIDITNI